MSIPRSPDHSQAFPQFYRDMLRRPQHHYYHAASLHAVALNNSQFAVYAMVAIVSNFGTRIADIRQRVRYVRGWRSKRQIARILASLVSRGYLVRHAPMHYSLTGRTERRDNARLRPLRPALLHAAALPETALYARFMLAIAATRKRWDRWTWRDVRQAMRCDTGTAQGLYAALQAVRAMRWGGTIQAARRAVFASERPEWYRYREHAGGRVLMDPRPGAVALLTGGSGPPGRRRSENVHPGVWPIGCIAKAVLTSRADGPDLGGRPARKRGRRLDREVAAKVLSRARRRRRRSSLDTVRDQGAATTANSGARRAPRREGDRSVGSVFESLIAGLPPAVRTRFETMPAVVAERRRRRLGLGYRT